MNLAEKAKNIKLLVMDVDGTLTDSAMYYSQNGEELKRFSTRDGMGITLLHRNGIKTAVLTSENSLIAKKRAEKLQIEYVLLNSKDKPKDLISLSVNSNIALTDIAYIGDDINDAEAMKLCGLSACPADAVQKISEIADIILSKNGGNGAVREFAEYILESQNKPIDY